MTSQATSASVAANVVSGAWRRVLLLGEGLATRVSIMLVWKVVPNSEIIFKLMFERSWVQDIRPDSPQKGFQDLGMWAYLG